MPDWTLYQWEQVCTEFMANCDADLCFEIQRRLAILKEQGDRARMPTSRKFKGEKGLWEFRANTHKENARFLYCFLPGRKVVFLEAAYKTDKLPKSVVKRAAERLKLVKDNTANVIPL